MQIWVDRLEAAERHGNRLDLIGASSVKRGTARGPAEEPTVLAARTAAPAEARGLEALAQELARDAEVRTVESSRSGAPLPERPAAKARAGAPAVDDEQPYAPETAFEALPELEARVKDVFGRTGPLPWEQPAPDATGASQVVEPPAVTGHTRRVEVFDLVPPRSGAQAAATDVDPAPPGDDPTVERDRRIVELARQGLNQREIAQRVSASRSTVSRVVRRYEDQKPVPDDDRELANA
nr:helix-turn-helix domain-containing protein [Cellulosimicrobium arenosum]